MKDGKVRKIDFSRKRISSLADKCYNEGDYVSALRLAYRQLKEYGLDFDVTARLTDIYEAMGLQGSAINCWFQYLDVAEREDLPDVFEGLAVNFLAIGNETQSAYYYNQLIDADESLPEETKMDIVDAFAHDKRDGFRFVYPPKLADYTQEMNLGSKALKNGDCKRAIREFSKVEKGSKDYVSAKEMQAVAHLLAGEVDKAEQLCLELLQDEPEDVRILATLAATYIEQGRTEESLALAKKLAAQEQTDSDDLYKVATVCCENGLHEEAYQKFSQMDKKLPYDGRMLYFRAVAAYKSGRLQAAEDTLDTLCTIYPDAEVAKYYLQVIRDYKQKKEESEDGASIDPPELTYFYHIPQSVREERFRALLNVSALPRDEAQMLGLILLYDGFLSWCFDEMDGNERELQYLALVTANHIRADEFIRNVLLDFEVADVLKMETLRMLLERNEDMDVGIVLCNIYRRVFLQRIRIGRKSRKKFLEAYAKITSKFIVMNELCGNKLRMAAEDLYNGLAENNAFDLLNSIDDCSCAIFFLSGLKELGQDRARIAQVLDANLPRAQVLATYGLSHRFGISVPQILEEEMQEQTKNTKKQDMTGAAPSDGKE